MNEQTRKVMFSSNSDEWKTPWDLFNILDKKFGPFTLDPAANPASAKCKKYYTKEDDGLSKSWEGETVFVNPPYTKRQSAKWIKKAYEESLKPNTKVIVLAAARPDTVVFHDYCMKASMIYFIKGRVKFIGKGKETNSAPFPSMVVVFEGKEKDDEFIDLYSLEKDNK